MPNRKLTGLNVRLYMEYREKGKRQNVAAAKADISVRTARRIDKKEHTSFKPKKRRGRTKPDPFVDVWENFLLPALRGDPHLEATFLLRELQQRYPGQYPDSVLRTLQRRISDWRAIEGPEKEIIFRQEHPPGWQCLSDFTDDKGLKVSINGEPFPHRFYHLRSAFSLWEYVRVITGGESFTALAEGLQNGLWELGGVFETHRTDSLSAAFKNKSKKDIEDLTKRYEELCTHCGMKATRNNKGVKHENGAVEISHRFFRSDLKQALSLRESRDFSSVEEYRKFVAHRVSLANARRIDLINEESKFLKPLPDHKACDFEELMVKVTTSSLIRVKQSLYSVPSRLIGKTLRVHLFDDRLECYLGSTLVQTWSRQRWNKGTRPHKIHYGHLIHWLYRKPQAFRNYQFREELFPTDAFRKLWEMLDSKLDERSACREYVSILKLYSDIDQNKNLPIVIEKHLQENKLPSSKKFNEIFLTNETNTAQVCVKSPEPETYDQLLQSIGG